tara:strand:+ start:6398 stop:8839 length:2442 start_codon:yes stop_codon:yes gene_type:complete
VSAALTSCFHCGLDVPARSDYRLSIDGSDRSFCCPGCQAVAGAIVDGGLEHFYQFRTENSIRPDEKTADFAVFDLLDIQQDFVYPSGDTRLQAQLLLEGISCAACVWLIEHHLGKIPGVVSVRVNATTHRCLIEWQTDEIKLSELMAALSHIGYQPIPATEDRQQQLREKENRTALMRLAVAGFGMMQVGMVAVALYTGADASWEIYLRWLSFIIATPVVLFSSKPFFSAARSAILARHLTMDVPVSIAIGGAYIVSTWATVFGGGEVYFDSVSMFTFFLLWGRYLEMRARHRNGIESDRLAQVLPPTAQRADESGNWRTIPLKQLAVDDRVLVASGSAIPCDGEVIEGNSGVVETLLTGEPDAVQKQPGDVVIAGTVNTESALQIRVTAVGQSTRLSAIERLVEQAQQEKPSQVALADRLAGYFVAAVLLVSTLVAFVWWQLAPEQAVWITLSVLVVTCPCALSLASPTALTAAVAWLRQHGLLVTRGHVLEGLTEIQRVVFDKTGTLTVGSPQIQQCLSVSEHPVTGSDRDYLLSVCAALEIGSTHPIAKAFDSHRGQLQASSVQQFTAQGVEGEVAQRRYRLGKPGFIHCELQPPAELGQWLVLAEQDEATEAAWQPILWIQLQDQLRDSAASLVAALKNRGLTVQLLSGDGEAEVARVAQEIGFSNWSSNQSPKDKLATLQELQLQGEKVLMVGDGINDVPVLSGADVSVAMGGATDLAQTRADSVLLGSDLMALDRAFSCAEMTRRIIRQNLTWALCYNAIALPLAAMGWVPPWAAAIGMSASSLVVVGNALRISRQSTATPDSAATA